MTTLKVTSWLQHHNYSTTYKKLSHGSRVQKSVYRLHPACQIQLFQLLPLIGTGCTCVAGTGEGAEAAGIGGNNISVAETAPFAGAPTGFASSNVGLVHLGSALIGSVALA